MAVTMDELIGLKDDAVDACAMVIANWERGDLAAAANACAAVVARSNRYDQADQDDSVVSLEEWEERHGQ